MDRRKGEGELIEDSTRLATRRKFTIAVIERVLEMILHDEEKIPPRFLRDHTSNRPVGQ